MKKELVDKMSVQEAVEYAVTKIVEQGGQCINQFDSCIYGDDKGNHCAVGWLLDEENYSLMSFGGSLVSMTKKGFGDCIPELVLDNIELFYRLQAFHDNELKFYRAKYLKSLEEDFNIDISNPVFQQWVDMGNPDE